MRRVILLVVGSLALMLAAPASSANTVVQIKRTGFVPVTVTINQNDSVRWKNVDTINHQVVGNGGTFRYHDSLHPSLKGTVIVRGAPDQVTLAASVPVVKFGGQVTLTGTVRSEEHTSELQS